jgi:2,3-bisphosphoglycerate-independent phosphoglycerate mutase
MKYIILLGDGMADYPLDELGGKTPLEAAHTPNLDEIAGRGTLGLIDTIPEGFTPGSDVANLSVLGYNPTKYFTGRGPLEAANMGVQLSPNDIAFRCNLVSLTADADPNMADYSAGHISTAEGINIIQDLDKAIGSDKFRFYPGVGYRHLMVWKDGQGSMDTAPPHDIVGEKISDHFPKGNGADEIRFLMEASKEVLKRNQINLERAAKGKKTADSIWLWGQGRRPEMAPLSDKYGLRGGIISAVNLLNGIGYYAGLEIIQVEGATGYIDTNYEGKAQKALEALNHLDFMFLHVEAPDEMGHEGNLPGKIQAIEQFDEKVVGTVLRSLPSMAPARLMVLSDHPTPVHLKTHVSDPSPFAVLSSESDENVAKAFGYGEKEARRSGIIVSPGYDMIDYFILNWRKFVAEKRQ